MSDQELMAVCSAKERYAPVCPEFVIELRSPGGRLVALQEMTRFRTGDTRLAQLMDPERKVVETHRPGQATEFLEGLSAVLGDGPVNGFVWESGPTWD